MESWLTDRNRLAVLIAACGLLSSIEALIPLFRYPRGRLRRAMPNLVLAIAVVATNLAFASMMASLSAIVTRNHFGLLAGWGGGSWMMLLLGVAGLDLSAYVAHLLMHKSALGWRFHRVHHSELEVDVTTAFRQHPGETIWRVFWQCIGIVLLGLPFWIVPVYVSISSLNALLEHANVRMSDPVDQWIRLLLVTPNMHKIHHSRVVAQTDSNYANIFSMWDRLFRTHTAWTRYEDLRYGLDGFDDDGRQALLALVSEPFRPAGNES